MDGTPTRRWLVAAVPAMLVAVALLGAVAPAATAADAEDPCRGTVTSNASGTTVVSVQGTRFLPDGAAKTTAYVMAVDASGHVTWVHNNSAEGRWWTYDVDPLPNGNLLVTTTEPGRVIVTEYDPETGEHVYEHAFENAGDAHDVDLVDGELIVADKGNDRVFAYDRDREAVTWTWNFSDHFEASHGGPPDDWTHLNDVDAIDEHRYLLSAKSFNQVLIVNRTTGDVEEVIGDDDDPSILNAQHNPQYQVSADGTPTILVADSENDRVVEFVKTEDGDWRERYVLRGGGLNQPRDADWLPNGNLLVSDRLGHRVLEVTPTGRVVWEVYSPWQTYDAERVAYGDEPDAPNSVDLNVSGTFRVDSRPVPTRDLEACAAHLRTLEGRTGAVGTPGAVTATPTSVDRHGEGVGAAALPVALVVVALALVGGWHSLRRP